MTTPLLDQLRQAVAPPTPKDWRPGVVYSGSTPTQITTPPIEGEQLTEAAEWERVVREMGVPVPEGCTLELVSAELAGSDNPASWMRDREHRGEKDTAYTARNVIQRWRYKFRVVRRGQLADVDLAKLMKEAKAAARQAVRPVAQGTETSLVVDLADFQVGKVDLNGGTPELLQRSEFALAEVLKLIRKHKPTQVVLVDGGDSTEGFESSPNANRTNDLQMTEQITVWRRIFWRWIVEISRIVEWLDVIGVPSNHCRVRSGKQELGPPDDDWGLAVMGMLADMAKVDESRFGHVVFHVPEPGLEYVVFDLMGGKLLGVIHGHQFGKAANAGEWLKKQGRRPLGLVDIALVNHFHSLRVESYGDGQTLFVAPSNDGGSGWFTNTSGDRSRAGVLTFIVDSDGWRDMHVVWTN